MGRATLPFLGERYGVAAITTDMDLAHDLPLAPRRTQPRSDLDGFNWKLGHHSNKSAFNRDPFSKARLS